MGYAALGTGSIGGFPRSKLDTSDPDYQKILAMCQDGQKRLESIKRFDMPGFLPAPSYVREMQRFGILFQDAGGRPIDVYETDRRYWRSHWWPSAGLPEE